MTRFGVIKTILKYILIGAVAGAVMYVGVEARYTRDILIYSQGVVKGVDDCKKMTKTSMPIGDTEKIDHGEQADINYQRSPLPLFTS